MILYKSIQGTLIIDDKARLDQSKKLLFLSGGSKFPRGLIFHCFPGNATLRKVRDSVLECYFAVNCPNPTRMQGRNHLGKGRVEGPGPPTFY